MVRNTVKNRQSWCSAVICWKRGAFDMKFHLMVVSIFLETPIGRKKDLISMYRGTPVGAFANILVYFNKLANNF